ncbi:MAG: protein kinase, partial [Gemmatimonadales bacterium]|nr:protein kinase [Gemmatimonadales bacterium]NIN50926.1 protein kinase [Gemmatimonadales bacterium]NIP08390.1 protein kinase [Gemmatimonadales bacterium]NIR03586.1 protein kinase [Gemmatimonadales bacterium]
RDQKLDRPVAVKVLRPELAASLGAERFLREIEIAAKLTHPNILSLHDCGEADGLLYYVMPYVEGESLRDRLNREKQLPIEDALQITREVADALGYAHSLGIVHRDIKPENVMFAAGHAVVSDFGIAKAVSAAGEEALTETGLAVGTPAYMSPEQGAGSGELDGRSDIYSLACVLYEMLAGEPPYTGPTAQALIAKRLADPVPAVSRLRDTVPAGVERALMKALAKVAADRFASAVAFAEALAKPAVVRPSPRSVAVLPFLNLSADPENEYFADGVTEDVTAQLSKIGALKVISRTSVMSFKKREQSLREIGARLGVATLLEGSVRRAEDRIRIVAQLIDAETDQHLWAETYDRQLTDIFTIQSDVALHIAGALEAELSADERTRIGIEPTSDLEAYQLYLKGRRCVSRFTPEGMRQGLEYYEQAIEMDPDYALSYTGVALSYIALGMGHGTGALQPKHAYRRAREAVAKALELDDGLGEAHGILGFLSFAYEFNWTDAEREFKRALELNPGSADTHDLYGLMLSALEQFDDAIAAQRRAQELDPLTPYHSSDLASTLLRAGRYDEASQEAKRVLELEPHFPLGHSTLGWTYLKQGMRDEGLAELEKAVSLSPENTIFLAQLGQAYASAGKAEKAREVLQELEELSRQRYVPPYHMAYVYTGLGEQDKAIDALEQAYEERAGGVYGIKGSFLFTALRSHPRFKALLARMNLD